MPGAPRPRLRVRVAAFSTAQTEVTTPLPQGLWVGVVVKWPILRTLTVTQLTLTSKLADKCWVHVMGAMGAMVIFDAPIVLPPPCP